MDIIYKYYLDNRDILQKKGAKNMQQESGDEI